MKSIFSGFLISVLLVLPVYAVGVQANDDGDDPGQSSHHDDAATEGGHHHEATSGAVGSPAQPSAASQTIKVNLTDEMRIKFDRELASIKSGTIIQFIVTNEGKIPHEFSIGNQKEQEKHAEMMRKMPGMTHSDGTMLTVEPGMTKVLTWEFKGDDVVVFACNIPGHYEAGMFQKVVLSP